MKHSLRERQARETETLPDREGSRKKLRLISDHIDNGNGLNESLKVTSCAQSPVF